jgi:hypothetical protein
VFTTARRVSLFSAGRIQSMASSPISVRLVLIISSSLCLCFQSGCFHNILHQNPVSISEFPHTCHMTCPSHLIILTIYSEDNKWWIPSLCFFPFPVTYSVSSRNIFLSTPISNTYSHCSSSDGSSFTPIHISSKIIILHNPISPIFAYSNGESKSFKTEKKTFQWENSLDWGSNDVLW